MQYTISPRQVTGGVVACVSTTGPRRADQRYGPGSIPQTGSMLQVRIDTPDWDQYRRPESIL